MFSNLIKGGRINVFCLFGEDLLSSLITSQFRCFSSKLTAAASKQLTAVQSPNYTSPPICGDCLDDGKLVDEHDAAGGG